MVSARWGTTTPPFGTKILIRGAAIRAMIRRHIPSEVCTPVIPAPGDVCELLNCMRQQVEKVVHEKSMPRSLKRRKSRVRSACDKTRGYTIFPLPSPHRGCCIAAAWPGISGTAPKIMSLIRVERSLQLACVQKSRLEYSLTRRRGSLCTFGFSKV